MAAPARFKHFPLPHILGIGTLLLSLAAIAFWPAPNQSLNITDETRFVLELTEPVIEEDVIAPVAEANNDITWEHGSVQSGDSFSVIFDRYNLGASTLHNLIKAAPKDALKIQPQQKLRWHVNDEQQLQSFVIELSALSYDIFERQDDGSFTYERITKEAERHPKFAQVTISNSLFVDGQRAGIPDQILYDLANIFGWDIDFALDIRDGDSFSVIYEELFLEGERIGYGNILTTKFFNRGRELTAVRYTNAEGRSDYYTPDGRSMRKEFLRNPIDFTRISSRFSNARKHPVLQSTIRAHKGTDYAAPTGTPIKASGDGKIIFAGRKGGYGNAIILQHGQSYTTLYGHLSRFHKNTKTGRYVKQGQVIGYVGMTGLASGPHLHYEFRVNGVHRDPLTVKLPQAQSIAKKQLAEFKESTQGMVSWLENQLESSTPTMVTSNFQ